MFFQEVPKTRQCQVVARITDARGAERCLKPATVVLALHTPEPILVCPDCARELAKEILDSVPGGKYDAERARAEREARTAARL
jgi:hypothetical protein